MPRLRDFLRVAYRDQEDHERVLHCEEPGCDRHTTHGKPFCLAHVEKNPYAAELLGKAR